MGRGYEETFQRRSNSNINKCEKIFNFSSSQINTNESNNEISFLL